MWTLKLLVFVLLLFAVDVGGSDDGDLTANKTPTLSTNPPNQWWMIDLGEPIEVTNIELYGKAGSNNIAKDKPVEQSSPYKNDAGVELYGPEFAVDGNTDGSTNFTHTTGDDELKKKPKWWMVDLKAIHAIGTIKLYNRDGYQDRLAKISIMISVANQPEHPSLTSNDWTRVNYQEEAYEAVGTINFCPPVEARHVAVYSEFNDSLTLAEVEIFGSHLENIYILTTHDSSAEVPSLTSNKWTARYYHEPPYGAIGNIMLEEGVPVQHVAVYTSHSEGMTLDKVKMFAYKNLAYKKMVEQSSNYSPTSYPAVKAVDGILYGDYIFSHTNGTTDNWWKVDLGEIKSVKVIELYCRTDQSNYNGFEQIKLLSSTNASVESPTTSNGWTELTTYNRVGDYAPVSVITLSKFTEMRHLAVKSDEQIVLKEVQIFQYPRHNHALGKTAVQSDTYDNDEGKYAAKWAVDGKTDGLFSHTAGKKAKEWWKVDLGKSIIFQYAKIYVRSGTCDSSTLCENRLNKITFLTNHNVTTQPPVDGANGWKKCLYHEQSMGKVYIMVCEANRTPYTRQFAISVAAEDGVALAEVQVYGYNQPLKRYNTAVVESNSGGNDELKIAFDRWKDIQTTKPWIYNTIPSISADSMQYTASINGHDPVIISPSGGSWSTDKISFPLPTNKTAYKMGRLDISCKMGDDVCPGPDLYVNNCTDPKPNVNLTVTLVHKESFKKESGPDVGRRYWSYDAQWQIPSTIYCVSVHDTEPVIYNIADRSEVITTNKVSFDVDAGTNVKFTLKIKDIEGRVIDFGSTDINAPEAAPGKPMSPSLVAVDDKCLSLSWDKPMYSNGDITRYEYNCTGRGWITTDSSSIPVCSYKPYTNVTCTVRAVTVKSGDVSDSVASTTSCAAPEPPTDLKWTKASIVEQGDGLRKWNYTFTWKAPTTINCKEIDKYKITTNTGQTLEVKDSTVVLSINAGSSLTVSITSVNNVGNESATSLSGTIIADDAAPSKPGNVKLQAVSSECVSLTWDPPQSPNGKVKSYQYNCTGKEWITTNKLSTQVCEYSPYTTVTCKVRAVTVKPGDISVPVTATTSCAAPEPPTDLKWTKAGIVEQGDGLRKWKYTLTWKAPTTINCKEIDKYEITTSEGQALEVKDSTVALSINASSSLTVYITSINNDGNESATPLSETIVADDAAPSKPHNVRLQAVSSECVSLTWDPPQFSNGKILNYQYNCTGMSQWITTADAKAKKAQACRYKPFDNVVCQLRANNSAVNSGDAATDFTTTLCAAPTFDASAVEEAYNTTNGTVRRRITISVKNIIKNCNGTSTSKYRMIREGNTSFVENNTFEDLDAVTEYTFEVKVVNSDNSFTTHNISKKTGELPPADAPTFTVDFSKKFCVTIRNIKGPKKPNGNIISYQAQCGYRSSTLSFTDQTTASNSKLIEICDLKSAAEVTCSVTANNNNYTSPARRDSGFTLPSIVNPPKLKIVPAAETDTVTITIMPMQFENLKPSEYLVLVWSNSARGKRATTTATCTGTHLTSYTTPQANKPCYVAVAISSSNVPRDGYPFKVGDGSTKGAYTNRRLAVGEEYTIQQAVTYKIGSEELIHVLDSSIKFTPEKKEEGPPIGAIVGSVVAVVVCTGIGIGIYMYIRWRRGKAPKKGEGEDPPLALSDLNSDPETKKPAVQTLPEPVVVAPLKPPKGALTPKPSTNKSAKKKTGPSASSSQAEASNMYGNLGTESQWVIPIDELEDFILGQKPVIDKQYELLEAQPAPTMDVALLPENKGKSRYKGLYPADGHRVTLKPDSSLSKRSTDYINASFIPGYKKGQMYIAAQGPTEATVDDFWLMIWQQKIAAIIMVTGAIEHGKVKCKQYWSDNHDEVMMFRDITVTHTFTEVWADYTIRTLQVTKDSDTRTIKHFNYITWPDHGVPNDMGPYITYFAKIKAATYRLSSTKLVHCSAGVGRTGTYIAMDKLLEQVEDKRVVDPFTCVTEMRLRRPCMIQTIEQYQFLYQAIVEFLHTSNYACSAPELDAKLRRRGQGRDMVAEEFAHIEKRVKLANFDYTLGKDPDNRDRNRFSEILPAKHCSLYLTGGKVSYINAIQVDAHREKNQWIVTQLPLSNTVTDFWELMVENQMTVLAQLEVSQVPFYPRKDGEQMEVGPFIISRTSAEQTDSITNVSLQLETANAVQDIQVILCRGWVSDVPSTDSIMELQNALEKVQQQTGNKKVCITCNNGSTRCGILICSYNAIEKLKAEQEADVYNPVLMAKHRRPQFIPSMDQYEFIYQVIRDYTEAFSEYANFK